ncbi:MAG: hypothetical protein RLZZ450_2951 [Pseudomonadota bacterium]
MGVPEAHVDDALQDVFVVVYQRLNEFDQHARVTTWLFQIALHVASNYRRKNKRAQAHTPLTNELLDPRPSPLAAAQTSQQSVELSALLSELGDDKRALLVLADLEEMTVPEIADLTNTPLNTVYTRLRRARAAFGALWQTHRQTHDE